MVTDISGQSQWGKMPDKPEVSNPVGRRMPSYHDDTTTGIRKLACERPQCWHADRDTDKQWGKACADLEHH